MIDEESIYRYLFENSGQGMVLRQGEKILLVNQSFADIVGYTIEQLLAFSYDDARLWLRGDQSPVWVLPALPVSIADRRSMEKH